MSLNSGAKTFFFDTSSPSSELFLPFPDLNSPLQSTTLSSSPPAVQCNQPKVFPPNMNPDIAAVWAVMAKFCPVINHAAEHHDRITSETFLLTMASVIYRLLNMTQLAANSTDEIIRLGLLAFSSSVFLQWKQLGLFYNHLTTAYRQHLGDSRGLKIRPPKLSLWLLMVGAVSVFRTEEDRWLKPRLRAELESTVGSPTSWTDVRDVLKSFMWIGLVHDKAGKDAFDAAMTGGLDRP